MKNRLVLLLIVLLSLLLAQSTQAIDEWNTKADMTGVACGGAGPGMDCYYVFDGTNDSTFISVMPGSSVCFNADPGGAAGTGEIQIRYAVSTETNYGSIPLLGVTLTANHPVCIFDLPAGRVMVDVTATSGTTDAVVLFRAQ